MRKRGDGVFHTAYGKSNESKTNQFFIQPQTTERLLIFNQVNFINSVASMNPVSNGITSSPQDSRICQDGRQRVPLIMFVPNLTLSKPMHTISGTNSRTPELRVSRSSTPHGTHVTRIYVCMYNPPYMYFESRCPCQPVYNTNFPYGALFRFFSS